MPLIADGLSAPLTPAGALTALEGALGGRGGNKNDQWEGDERDRRVQHLLAWSINSCCRCYRTLSRQLLRY